MSTFNSFNYSLMIVIVTSLDTDEKFVVEYERACSSELHVPRPSEKVEKLCFCEGEMVGKTS